MTDGPPRPRRSWLRDNGLSIALFALFALSLIGHAWAGWLADFEQREHDRRAAIDLFQYLSSGAFLSSLFENWESEFLQMAAYVVLTAYLFQRGSPESRDPDREVAPQDRDPAFDANDPQAPWPVRAGGLVRALYGHSLGAALVLLFIASFVFHWINSARHGAEEAIGRGEAPKSMLSRIGEAQFWFESFQNWQSEFLSTGVLIVLAIFLRERKSPESKPVGASHWSTGT